MTDRTFRTKIAKKSLESHFDKEINQYHKSHLTAIFQLLINENVNFIKLHLRPKMTFAAPLKLLKLLFTLTSKGSEFQSLWHYDKNFAASPLRGHNRVFSNPSSIMIVDI